MLRWDLNLAAKQSKEFRVEYAIEYSSDLPGRQVPSAAAKEAGPALELHEQIKALEKKF